MTDKSTDRTPANSQPLKVLFITHNYIRNKGDFAGVFLHLLARKLIEQNIEVHVVAPHDKGAAEYEEIDGVKINRFRYADDNNETFAYRGDMHRQLLGNPFKLFRFYKFLRSFYKSAINLIDKKNISIVSVHWIVPAGIVGKWLKKKYKDRIKLFVSSHGTDIRLLTRFSFLYNYLKPVILKAEKWTVVSDYLKQLLMQKDKSLEDKIEVVPLPNDESIFYPDEETSKENNLIVAVSRLTKQKRPDYLIKAIDEVRKNRPEIKLNIYGSGPEEVSLQTLISQLNLGKNVKILQPVPQKDLRGIYNQAIVVVLNSVEEGFGLVLTEAMLCGTAVIGTESGGITDIIVHEKSGLLVPPDDSVRLAGAILIILKDDQLRERLAKNGYNRAVKYFSSASSANQYARLYKN